MTTAKAAKRTRKRQIENPNRKRPVQRPTKTREAGKGVQAERVKVLADLMLKGNWFGGTCLEMAKTWGLSTNTVRKYSQMASQMLTWEGNGETECTRRGLLGGFDRAIKLAANAQDSRALVVALEAKARFLGIDKPIKIANTDTEGNTVKPFPQSWEVAAKLGTAAMLFVVAHGRAPNEEEVAALNANDS